LGVSGRKLFDLKGQRWKRDEKARNTPQEPWRFTLKKEKTSDLGSPVKRKKRRRRVGLAGKGEFDAWRQLGEDFLTSVE